VAALAVPAPTVEGEVDGGGVNREHLDAGLPQEPVDDAATGGAVPGLEDDAQLDHRCRRHHQAVGVGHRRPEGGRPRLGGEDGHGGRRVDDQGRHVGRPRSS